SGERRAERGDDLRREHHRRDAALHVARAAAVQAAVPHLGPEGVARPLLARLHGDRVDVAVEQEAPAAARAGEARGELRPAREVEARREERLALEPRGVRLPDLDLGAGIAEPVRQEGLEPRLVARRIADRAGGRVEADERGGELDELGPAAL